MVTPAGFEPAIFWMRTRRPKPLDDGTIFSNSIPYTKVRTQGGLGPHPHCSTAIFKSQHFHIPAPPTQMFDPVPTLFLCRPHP